MGCVTDAGEITLNYVAPDARFRGVIDALLVALEDRAMERGNQLCTLKSTETARRFYLERGISKTDPLTGTVRHSFRLPDVKAAGCPEFLTGRMPACRSILNVSNIKMSPEASPCLLDFLVGNAFGARPGFHGRLAILGDGLPDRPARERLAWGIKPAAPEPALTAGIIFPSMTLMPSHTAPTKPVTITVMTALNV